MLTLDRIKEIVQKICKKYGIKSAYLFGSYAKGLATQQSDVDLLIDKGDLKTYYRFYNCSQDLENELGVKVDLITTDAVKNDRFFDLIKPDLYPLYEGTR